MYSYSIKNSQFCKRLSKGLIIFIEKNIENKNILPTFKTQSKLETCGISKHWKLKKCFKNTLKFQTIKSPCPHIDGL
jgi:hypothetical protein